MLWLPVKLDYIACVLQRTFRQLPLTPGSLQHWWWQADFASFRATVVNSSRTAERSTANKNPVSNSTEMGSFLSFHVAVGVVTRQRFTQHLINCISINGYFFTVPASPETFYATWGRRLHLQRSLDVLIFTTYWLANKNKWPRNTVQLLSLAVSYSAHETLIWPLLFFFFRWHIPRVSSTIINLAGQFLFYSCWTVFVLLCAFQEPENTVFWMVVGLGAFVSKLKNY